MDGLQGGLVLFVVFDRSDPRIGPQRWAVLSVKSQNYRHSVVMSVRFEAHYSPDHQLRGSQQLVCGALVYLSVEELTQPSCQ